MLFCLSNIVLFTLSLPFPLLLLALLFVCYVKEICVYPVKFCLSFFTIDSVEWSSLSSRGSIIVGDPLFQIFPKKMLLNFYQKKIYNPK